MTIERHRSGLLTRASSWVKATVRFATLVPLILGVVVTLGAGLYLRSGSGTDPVLPGHLDAVRFAEALEGGHWLGPTAAPVVVLVFHDYLCGYSSELQLSLDALRARYPHHIAVVVKHFVDPQELFTSAARGALGAECAAQQDAFSRYHAAAFEESRSLGFRNGPERVAMAAGVAGMKEFEACLGFRRPGDRIAAHFATAQTLGVTGTPTTFINGTRVVGAASLETLDVIVAGHLRGRKDR
jgi:protein-disulfide isomerase